MGMTWLHYFQFSMFTDIVNIFIYLAILALCNCQYHCLIHGVSELSAYKFFMTNPCES